MKKVIAYQVVLLLVILAGFLLFKVLTIPEWILQIKLAINCCMIAALGGILYCLRSVYLNRCVHNRWDEQWEVWYYLRPITSSICGVVAYLFLKASLVVLDASQNVDSGEYGYLAFAFLAGLNVDKFVEKIEDLGKSLFGIEKSRVSKSSSENK
ncbi:MAG: hypothetical protein Q7U16_04655 [Agitococcus sp.]|nr:hypothetical protein [Agitococcus sp.]